MKQFTRISVAVLSLVGIIAWTMFTAQVWQFGNSFKGMGDGTGADGGGAGLLSILLVVVIWFLPVSPYLCMAAGSLNLVTGKSLRVAHVYSLVVLSIMTLIMLISFQRRLEFMALGNFVGGGLWVYSFREKTAAKEHPKTPVE